MYKILPFFIRKFCELKGMLRIIEFYVVEKDIKLKKIILIIFWPLDDHLIYNYVDN